MTYLVERLAELRLHLDHLRELAPRVTDASSLRRDLSLHNDVLFSLLTVCQSVIDIAGELSGRKGRTFTDYTQSIHNLEAWDEFDPELVQRLAELPGFRNVLLHEYVTFDLDRAIDAMDDLGLVERFAEIVRGIESGTG